MSKPEPKTLQEMRGEKAQNPEHIDSLGILIPLTLWMYLFIITVAVLRATVGPVIGEGLCGLGIAVGVATVGAYEMNKKLKNWTQSIADEHGSVAEYLFGSQ